MMRFDPIIGVFILSLLPLNSALAKGDPNKSSFPQVSFLTSQSDDPAPIISLRKPDRPFVIDGILEIEFAFAFPPLPNSGPGVTGHQSITLHEVTVCPPQDVLEIWRQSKCHDPRFTSDVKIDVGHTHTERVAFNNSPWILSPSAHNEVSESITGSPAKEASDSDFGELYEATAYWFHFLTFEPREYSFLIRTKYTVGGQAEPRYSEQELTIPMEPPLFVLIVGAALGSALLGGFLFSLALWREPDLTFQFILRAATRCMAIFFIGALSAIIFVLLTYRFKTETLPVSITVNDLYGGVVIGFFTFKISDWLFDQLGGAEFVKKIA